MTPFWAFIVGMLGTGTILSIVFGAIHLDAEEEAYRKGYEDGLGREEEQE